MRSVLPALGLGLRAAKRPKLTEYFMVVWHRGEGASATKTLSGLPGLRTVHSAVDSIATLKLRKRGDSGLAEAECL
jgi:hypothetical protein